MFPTSIGNIAEQLGRATQEMVAPVEIKREGLYIGIPKERSFQENRIAITPESVMLLTSRGHKVRIEAGAGEKATFSDRSYAEAGAEMVYDVKQVFEAEVILKVAPPTLDEIALMRPMQIIFSPLHLPTINRDYMTALTAKRVTGIAYEYIKDEAGSFPMVRTLSEIAGNTAILIAAEYLSRANEGQGILLGGISGVPPARVVILGAGVVGEFATRTAMGLGAEVRIFDNNIYKLMRLQNNVNSRIFTSIINPNTLLQELVSADVVIGAIHAESGRTPLIVTENMVAKMKTGAVIIDISIDQGGCFETSQVTTHTEPIFVKHGVIHYCVPNIASRVPQTASKALSHVLTPLLLKVQRHGGFERLLLSSSGMRHGVYTYKGMLTNYHLSERFALRYTSLELIMTSSI